jgi:hypothetical protein
VGFALLIWAFPACDADSKQARMAKSLSRERLADLHRAMAALWSGLPKEDGEVAHIEIHHSKFPAVFDGLNAAFVRIDFGTSIIRLEGCMDHHLDLVFFGVGEPNSPGDDHSPRIELWSGDYNRKIEVLWRPESVAKSPAAGD